MDLTNVKSGAMSRTGGSGTGGSGTGGSGTGGSAQPEEVQERRECTSGGSARVKGVCRWRKGGVAGGRSGVGHGNVLGHWWT